MSMIGLSIVHHSWGIAPEPHKGVTYSTVGAVTPHCGGDHSVLSIDKVDLPSWRKIMTRTLQKLKQFLELLLDNGIII